MLERKCQNTTCKRGIKMGYLVSSLTDSSVTPEISDEYCIYLIHEWKLGGVAKDISERFREYSRRLRNRASIFAASDQASYDNSFRELLGRDPWFKSTIGNYHDLSPGIMITKPGLPQFSARSGHVFIYASDEVINAAYHCPTELSQDIVDLCRHNEDSFIKKLIPYSRGTIVNSGPNTNNILDIIRDSIEISPNINGFGFKVRPIVDQIRRNHIFSRHNSREDNDKFDCVIYQF